jgi:penicillin-binding protein A
MVFDTVGCLVKPVHMPLRVSSQYSFVRLRRHLTTLGVILTLTPASVLAQTAKLRVDLRTLIPGESEYSAKLEGGGKAVLTINPALQALADKTLDENEVPFGAAVMVSIPDGKVLVLSGRSARNNKLGPAELAVSAWAPAASIFKLVSAAALISVGGVTPQTEACFAGGLHGIGPEHLRDNPKLDKQCESLALAVGRSQNAVLAKLSSRHLDSARMGRIARDFGFGFQIPFVAEFQASQVDLPGDPLEFARMSAGFFHSTLSPLHGALIAAAIGNGGLMPRPLLVESVSGKNADPNAIPARRSRRVVDEKVASDVGAMMEGTVRIGTARSGFYDSRGRAFLPFAVAGKTGSLNFRGRDGDPALPPPGAPDNYLQYSWFVGYAPYDKPQIAFATLVGNPVKWRIKATYLARRMLEGWAAEQKKRPSGQAATDTVPTTIAATN